MSVRNPGKRASRLRRFTTVSLEDTAASPHDARSPGEDGATALHAAAAGSAGTVRLLLDRGADIEARDTTWDSPPLGWAIVGSGMRLGHDPDPDWPATSQAGPPVRGILLACA